MKSILLRSTAIQIACLLIPLSTAIASEAQPSAAIDSPLSFAEFYKRPVGPKGLEPGAKLLALAGSRVRLDGYIAHGAGPQPMLAVLAPVPVALGDEDEGLADDLPAAVAYLHWTDPNITAALAGCPRAVRVTGRLELGRLVEADGRSSFVRLNADSVQCAADR